ncbi:uncharacterized protein (DUF2336 family) [Rhodopseudomonas rhenobacensis]|uniref:Uncharacterized protein (DUF2336 family) n=1 Tax=Rhodopseudomonas rhenobacensis TaxID=87461 RepID=A0A7W7Z453_9BRAD|nr:DUF2336 domain-containing protein [Rhodopseudomonas rhenobacensis]MBB5047677.1 uncharacterized protein (DUF2336 family) [Rhodopseudomonas rhenobacensis]
MPLAHALLPGLDDIVRNGDPDRCADAVRRIAELFIAGAENFHADHVNLFDGVLATLVPKTEAEVRGELAERLASLSNAPPGLVRSLAEDEEIRVAAPVLSRSLLIDDAVLVEIAKARGQSHLLAITQRPTLSPPLTEVIVVRGDGEVVRRLAGNAGAEFSPVGYSGLVRRAGLDDMLAVTIGQREDLPAPVLKELLSVTVDVVRRRLFDTARPAAKIAINRAMSELAAAPRQLAVVRDFGPAQRLIVQLHNEAGLTEAALLGFAKAYRYEESVAALSAMSGVRIATLDQLLMGERQDPILILGKSIGIEWATVRALIGLRLGPGRAPSAPDIEEARLNFQRLAPTTALRVLNFWRMREPGN